MNNVALAYQTRDAARALGIGLTKLYEFIGKGELEAVKIGGRTVVTAASMQAFLDSRPKADIRTGCRRATA